MPLHDIPDRATGPERLADAFKTGAALVAAAIGALEAMPSTLASMRGELASPSRALLGSIARLYRLVQDAAVGPDNLLVASRDAVGGPLTLRVVGRQPSGVVDVRTLEIDREALVLVGRGDGRDQRPLDLLADAVRVATSKPTDGARATALAALDHVSGRVAIGASRLSLAKARLDLQESFLASVLAADPAAPCVRIESHLDQTSARDLAQTARRLLNTRSLTIATGNRAVLGSLLRAEPPSAPAAAGATARAPGLTS